MDKKTGIIIALVVLLAGVFLFRKPVINVQSPDVNVPAPTVLGGSRDYLPYLTVATSSRHSVTTSSSLVIATSTCASYMVIVNDGSNPVYLSQTNGSDAAANQGIRLNALGGAYEMIVNDGNFYSGAITAISTGGTSNITITCK